MTDKVTVTANISIHALREEGDTTSQRGETASLNFYPRPPRGGRLLPSGWTRSRRKSISIHALREEGDRTFFTRLTTRVKFLSTPSARRATR